MNSVPLVPSRHRRRNKIEWIRTEMLPADAGINMCYFLSRFVKEKNASQ